MTNRFSKHAKDTLSKAGWSPGRTTTVDYTTCLKATGWPVLLPAIAFLHEFGGLKLRDKKRFWCFRLGKIRTVAYLGLSAEDLTDLHPDRDQETIDTLKKIGPCTPIGLSGDGSELFLMTSYGEAFGWLYNDEPAFSPLWRMGKSGDATIEFLCGQCSPEYLY